MRHAGDAVDFVVSCNLVDGDAILYIYGRYLKERGKLVGNKVVMTIMNNFGLCKALEAIDVECEKTNVGDKYVYEAMLQHGYRLGGEQTGHIIFKKYATTGDGILTAIKMMEVMLEKKTTLSELAQGYKPYPQVMENVRVAEGGCDDGCRCAGGVAEDCCRVGHGWAYFAA